MYIHVEMSTATKRKQQNFKLPAKLRDKLEKEAKKQHRTKTAIVEIALTSHFENAA